MNLQDLGWNKMLQDEFEEYKINGYLPARVSSEQKNSYQVLMESGEFRAILSDKVWFYSFDRSEMPVVGDWVAVSVPEGAEHLVIRKVMTRKSKFSRKSLDSYGRNFSKAGTSEEQILSANVDIVVMVVALDDDFNLRKIERYLTLMWDSGAEPVILLNKTDDCPDYEKYVAEAEAISYGIPVHPISAKEGFGMENVLKYIQKGKTVTFIGSSGVGKSTIINYLLGENRMKVYVIRDADHRGRHTTTYRQLIPFPNGGILIDNPGMRDIKVMGDPSNLDLTFRDIIKLSSMCKFRNCRHETEPGCAIKEAIESEELSEKRYFNYLKLKRELVYLERRQKKRADYLDNTRFKQQVLGIKAKRHRPKKFKPEL